MKKETAPAGSASVALGSWGCGEAMLGVPVLVGARECAPVTWGIALRSSSTIWDVNQLIIVREGGKGGLHGSAERSVYWAFKLGGPRRSISNKLEDFQAHELTRNRVRCDGT